MNNSDLIGLLRRAGAPIRRAARPRNRLALIVLAGTGPASMVTALGTSSLVTATAAGMVVSAATVAAVVIYAGVVWAWRAVGADESSIMELSSASKSGSAQWPS